MSRHPNDLAAEFEWRAYESQRCANGHHPDMVGRVEPVWQECEVCKQVEALRAEAPRHMGEPLPGWHIVLRPVSEEADDLT